MTEMPHAPAPPREVSREAPPEPPEKQPLWRNPYVLAVLAAMVIIPLMRPFLRFEPPPPAVIGELPAFELTSAEGQPFGSANLEGRVWVVNFIFTRCTSICPLLTRSMARLDQRYVEAGVDGIHLVSVTVDPEYDSPEVLRAYAEANGVDFDRWTFLTGPPDEVRKVVTDGFKTAMGEKQILADNIVDIAHTGKFILVDGRGGIRGYYDSDEMGIDEIFHRSQHVLKERR